MNHWRFALVLVKDRVVIGKGVRGVWKRLTEVIFLPKLLE